MAKKIIAAEALAKLQADPAYVEMRAKKDAELAAKAARFRVEQSWLLAELRVIGWDVNSVWDLVNTSKPYPEAIPVLLSHLEKPYSDRTREGIARALAVPDASGAWTTLRAEYESAPSNSGVKHGLAAALAATSNENVIDELVEIAKDRGNGSSRLLLLRGLRKSRSQVARETLAELKDDPALAKEIASWGVRKIKGSPPLLR